MAHDDIMTFADDYGPMTHEELEAVLKLVVGVIDLIEHKIVEEGEDPLKAIARVRELAKQACIAGDSLCEWHN